MNRETQVAFPDSDRFLINRSFITRLQNKRMKDILNLKNLQKYEKKIKQ